MGMTLTEKILARAAGRPRVAPGENVWIRVDLLLTHDVCGPGTIGIFHEHFGAGAKVFDPEKVVIIPDHYIYTEDPHARRNLDILREFAAAQKLPYFYDAHTKEYRGVCHVALAETGHTRPGSVIFGTDSHTCTAGAFGLFATGIGNTDAAFIMGTGQLWVRVPETMKFVVTGEFPPYVLAKDLILRVIGDIGVDGASYRALEFAGEAVRALGMEERMTLCNMAIEAGGKNGIIEADETTREYLAARGGKPYEALRSDPDASYVSVHTYEAAQLEPVLAQPHSPDRVCTARTLAGTKINRVYIGSCTGGKTADFVAAARVLAGRKTAVDTFVVPATRAVEADLQRLRHKGVPLLDVFRNAGCLIGPPSCAACLGGPKDTFGRTQGNEVVVSTTNRNFPGRMGSKASSVFLASPYTAAASAVKGAVCDPREFL